MEALKTLLPAIISASLALLILGIGLDAAPGDALYLVRHPRKLLSAFVAICIVVPIAAVAVVELLPLRAPVKAGILLMALAPLPPFLPTKAVKVSGDEAYVYGLYVAFSLLTVVIVPVTVEILSTIYRADVSLPLSVIGRMVLGGVLAPLAIGMATRALVPKLAQRLAPVVSTLAMAVLMLIVVLILIKAFPAIRAVVGDGSVLAICLVVAAAIAAGHLLGGPELHQRAALAASAATRHPGIALLIVKTNDLDRRIVAVILLFVLVSLLEFAIYQAWIRRSGRGRRGASGAVGS
jgi:BASS family bile acid:Na+ symporter